MFKKLLNNLEHSRMKRQVLRPIKAKLAKAEREASRIEGDLTSEKAKLLDSQHVINMLTERLSSVRAEIRYWMSKLEAVRRDT